MSRSCRLGPWRRRGCGRRRRSLRLCGDDRRRGSLRDGVRRTRCRRSGGARAMRDAWGRSLPLPVDRRAARGGLRQRGDGSALGGGQSERARGHSCGATEHAQPQVEGEDRAGGERQEQERERKPEAHEGHHRCTSRSDGSAFCASGAGRGRTWVLERLQRALGAVERLPQARHDDLEGTRVEGLTADRGQLGTVHP